MYVVTLYLDNMDSARKPLLRTVSPVGVNRDGVQTLEDVCRHVSEPTAVGHVKSLLPQYSCFVISPANLWFKDPKR